MKALDLFCGAAGGWSLGMHRAGYDTVAACEIEPWRRAVFQHNFPDTRMYADVRELSADRLVRDLGELPDIIVGSPPCQDASTANTSGRGVDGERTGLFFEATRLVREIHPDWFAFENVGGIRTRGIDRVLADLETEGYACWPLVVGAVHAGAPHLRKRMWLVGMAPDADSDTIRQQSGRCGRENGQGKAKLGRCDNSDTTRQRCGQGRQGRSAINDAGPQHQPHDSAPANPQALHGQAVAGNQPDGDAAGFIAYSSEHGAPTEGTSIRRVQPCTGKLEQSASHPDSPGLAIGQSVGSDDAAQCAPLERAIAERVGEPAIHWNGGIVGRCGMDDGLSKGLDLRTGYQHGEAKERWKVGRACLAAYGDAIVPQIAEAIGNSMRQLMAQTDTAPDWADRGGRRETVTNPKP